jgi:DNA mismatch repair protein MutS2
LIKPLRSKERSKWKTSQTLKEEETKAREEGKKLETNVKIKQKLESYQELYDSNQKTIYIGQN